MKDLTLDKALKKAKAQPVVSPYHTYRNELVKKTYIKNGGNTNATARELGISRVQVWRERKKWAFEGCDL